MLRRILLSLTALLAASAHAQPEVLDESLSLERVADGLDEPTSLAFLGPDEFLVLEKETGRVRHVAGGVVSPAPVLALAVNGGSERGLLGIAVHPELGAGAGKDWVYLYYTTSGDGGSFVNRLERYEWDGSALGSPLTLHDFPSFTSNHNGGPLAFGPDGMLYGVVGDGGRDDATQNNEDAADVFMDTGIVFRLEEDGSLPADNPFVADGGQGAPEARYFAYGIRNSFGLAFDPFTDELWDTENGPSEFDEINRLVPGANSGWRDVMGPLDEPVELVELPGSSYVDPAYSVFSPTALTGLAFASADTSLGAAHEGSLFVADFLRGNVYAFPPNAARDGLALADLVAEEQAELDAFRFATGFAGGVTDLEEGPDGHLYVVAFGLGEVWRLRGNGGDPEAHELAIAELKAPRRVLLRAARPAPTKRLKVTLVNRGTATASIDDLAALESLVALDWTSLGACPAPAAELRPSKQRFPIVLRPRKKLALRWDVTWDCANDPERSRRGADHADFELGATLSNGASGGPLRVDVVVR